MRYIEKLNWILDSHPKYRKGEEEYQINIDFVHSLGLKCDCVGWSTLVLGTPEADRVLDAISDFCKREGWYARGWYTREFAEPESDWYALGYDGFKNYAWFKDGTLDYAMEVPAEDGGTLKLNSLKAYRELMPAPKAWGAEVFVPDRFRKAFLSADLKGGTFSWAKDTGKYQAEQYFHLFADRKIPQYAGGRWIDYSEWNRSPETDAYPPADIYEKMKALGGSLPKLAKIFYELHITLPVCFLASDLAAQELDGVDIAAANGMILVRNSAAEALYQNGGIAMSSLIPIPIVEAFPEGYKVLSTNQQARPTAAYIEETMKGYEKIMAMPRPIRKISEKDALKVLRNAKKERKEDFAKRISKAVSESLADSEFAPLLPYYQVAFGGVLSDEYSLLSVEESLRATEEWRADLAKEELLSDPPQGLVIAKCPDGDKVILTNDCKVIRFSHEAPETIREWENLPLFIYESITEME